jgi:TolA-binding protein
MQMNFHKRYTGMSKPTLAIETRNETRNDGINQMSLNNALNTLHNKMNTLEKVINENNREYITNDSTSQNNETIVFDLEKKMHHMEKQIEELYQNFDSLQIKFNKQQQLISKLNNSNVVKREETKNIIPNDHDLKNMIKPLIELDSMNNVVSVDEVTETTNAVQGYSETNRCISLYDISYEYFIDTTLLDDIQDIQDFQDRANLNEAKNNN